MFENRVSVPQVGFMILPKAVACGLDWAQGLEEAEEMEQFARANRLRLLLRCLDREIRNYVYHRKSGKLDRDERLFFRNWCSYYQNGKSPQKVADRLPGIISWDDGSVTYVKLV